MKCSTTLNCGELVCFCLPFVTLRTTHEHYVGKWRRESVAVLHWQSCLCNTYLPSVPLLVWGLLWHSRAHWLKWNGLTVTSMVSQTLVWLCLCVVCGVCMGVWWETEGGEGEIVCANVHAIVMVYMGAWLCVRVFEMYLHCVCPSLVNVGTRVWVVGVTFLYFT